MPGLNNTAPSNWIEAVTGRTQAQRNLAAYNIAKASAGGTRNVVSKTGKLLYEASTGRMTSYGSWLTPTPTSGYSGGGTSGRRGAASRRAPGGGGSPSPATGGPGVPSVKPGVPTAGPGVGSGVVGHSGAGLSWFSTPNEVTYPMPFGMAWQVSEPNMGQDLENAYSEWSNLLVVPWLAYDALRNTYAAGEAVGRWASQQLVPSNDPETLAWQMDPANHAPLY